MGQPAYEQFWEDVTEARTDGRHNRVAVPLFVSDSEGDTGVDVIVIPRLGSSALTMVDEWKRQRSGSGDNGDGGCKPKREK